MRLILLTFLSLFFVACSSSNSDDIIPVDPSTEFDRSAMLSHWANNIIIPGYANLKAANEALNENIETFIENPNVNTLSETRLAHKNAYLAWQKVAFFEVGPAKNENLRQYFNIYPTDASGIETLLNQTDYQLHLTSNSAKQGYPALDYLLNGLGESDLEIINKYTDDANASNYKRFIEAVSDRLEDKTELVYDAWQTYKDTFIANNGSSATSSVDLVANDFLLFYEKYYRNGKIRIPAGYDTGVAAPEKVESYYAPEFSLELFDTATMAMRDFYLGKNFNSNATGPGFDSYLKYLNREDIATDITNGFNTIITTSNALNGTLKQLVISERQAILNLNDKIQQNVIPLKVEMLQALNISVAYYDGDGD
ncbi:hypothetical protein GO491_03355 [Flavobacteriaceae bacterium Ap0902]|nr:hypothetical protein [Flavobacteriaceae bacterium Ap0902]